MRRKTSKWRGWQRFRRERIISGGTNLMLAMMRMHTRRMEERWHRMGRRIQRDGCKIRDWMDWVRMRSRLSRMRIQSGSSRSINGLLI